MTALKDALGLQALGCPVTVDTDYGRLLVMSWETGRLHRLLAAHPRRRIDVPEWALPDFDVITGHCQACGRAPRRCRHAFPLPITPPEPPGAPPLRPGRARLEDALRALAAGGCRPMPGTEGRWRAMCPLCMLRGRVDRRVLITFDRGDFRARLHCFSTNHTDAELTAALIPTRRLRVVPGDQL